MVNLSLHLSSNLSYKLYQFVIKVLLHVIIQHIGEMVELIPII